MSIEQDEDFVVRNSSEEGLQNIECYSLPTPRRKNPSASFSAVELFSFQSVNGSLSFLGMTVSPFAAFASISLQQTRGNPRVHNICRQMAMLRVVKSLVTFWTFRKPPRATHDLSVLIFADAARPSAHAQIGFVGGLLVGTPTHVQSGRTVMSI